MSQLPSAAVATPVVPLALSWLSANVRGGAWRGLMTDDGFELWLGRIGKDTSFRGAVRRVVNLAGGPRRPPRSSFTGSRMGRGSAVGSLLASSRGNARPRARRVMVKARIERLAGKGAQAAAAHLQYLQRGGTTREGARGKLYAADGDKLDGREFLERSADDRHQFRLILSPEDGSEYEDLQPLVRRWMAQAERDLGTSLEWIAVDHFDTGHPHSHVLVRGKDDRGHDLVMARNYLSQGLRERAAEIVNLDLGPRSDREIAAADRREVTQERFTGIDRRLLRAVGSDGLVGVAHRDPREQSLRAGRIGTLVRMGLAARQGRGRWRLDANLETTLRGMERRGDIIATINSVVRDRGLDIGPAAYAIHEPDEAGRTPVVGRVVERGMAEHGEDRTYLVVDGIDGLAHYVDCGVAQDLAGDIRQGVTVRIVPVSAEVREADRTVAAIAEANGGYYSAELHAIHDPSAGERFIAAHVRRLEALQRLAGATDRDAQGIWRIAPDHLERALGYEQLRARSEPVRVTVLADRPLEELARHDGITVLDEDPDLADASGLGGGFGRTVAAALASRRQWLAERGFGEPRDLAALRQGEIARIAARLSYEFARAYVEVGEGGTVRGTYRQSVQVGALRMAAIDDGSRFALVPWRPVIERQIGRELVGVMRGGEVSWSFGRQRAGPER
jgi:type IV secretory pathway VirD2 relaxase